MEIILLSYLVGAVPTGYLLSKYIVGEDIRLQGSGNIGATNMTRVLGKKYGAITLGIDLLKSFLVVQLGMGLGVGESIVQFSCISVLLGNCFSVFLKGKGGKGVATSFGIYLAISPLLCFLGVLLYGMGLKFSKISAIGSLAAVIFWPLAGVFIFETWGWVFVSLALSCVVIVRHYENILKLKNKY